MFEILRRGVSVLDACYGNGTTNYYWKGAYLKKNLFMLYSNACLASNHFPCHTAWGQERANIKYHKTYRRCSSVDQTYQGRKGVTSNVARVLQTSRIQTKRPYP